MKVESNIKKIDIIYMQYYLMPRLKTNIVMYFVLFLLSAFSSIDLIKSNFFIFVLSVFCVTSLWFLLFYTAIVFMQLLFLRKDKGCIGEQLIEVDDVYFSETTAGTQTKTKWIGIDKLFKSKRYIYVMISGFRVHIIPKRSFENDAQFEAFWQLINTHCASK